MTAGLRTCGAEPLDRRVTAARPDLADLRLEGRVAAARFVAGVDRRVAAPLAPMRARPDIAASVTATRLLGETLRVFETADGWAWAQAEIDGYVGYLPADALAEAPLPAAASVVAALRTHLYPAPDLKAPPVGWAPLGARLALADPPEERARFRRTRDGAWVYAAHLRAADAPERDWVAVAERFLGAPYLWGGDSADGLDCSGLVAAGLRAAGRRCPRDSDQQEAALGRPLDAEDDLARGDLVFWAGHVGVMLDGATLLHSNAWHMAVAREPLAEAVARIEASGGGRPTSMRRLDGDAGGARGKERRTDGET